MNSPSPWWSPHVHADRRPFLLGRARIQAAVRDFFAGEDFIEVDTAALQVSPGNEAHLHAFTTERIAPGGERSPLFLHTSPEFAAKKLLAAGETRIFSLQHVYRNRERGPLHHPEFTMLEWYRVGASYETLMEDCSRLLSLAAETAGTRLFRFRGRDCDPFAPPERLSVGEAFARFADIDLLGSISANGEPNREHLANSMREKQMRVAKDDTWSDLLSRVLVERIELNLGLERPTILDRYPLVEAALARPCPDDGRVAERFELYACGVELANGFGELTDSIQQRRRFGLEMAEKRRVYGEDYPIDEDFLQALSIMPEASGIALGFDRLVLLATGASSLDQVIWTPVTERVP